MISKRWIAPAMVLAMGVLFAGCETTSIQKTLTVAGLVVDSKTKKPIPGAKVMFLDRKDTLTTTNRDGEFICGPGYMKVPFEIPLGTYITLTPETRIQVTAKGYERKVLQAYRRVEWTNKNQMPPPKVLVIALQRKSS
jgi:hypothetical protein